MRTAFLCLLSLIAGIAVGLILNFAILGPSHTSLNASTQAAVSANPEEAVSMDGQDASILKTTPVPTPDPEDNLTLLNRAFSVLTALKDRNYAALATLVHPQKGVTFTPYSTVDTDANLNFSADQIAGAADNSEKYIWGLTDGQGTPIKMTMSDYFDLYVYNADYLQAPEIGVDQVMASGNSLENVTEAYSDGRFVEFHFPGLEEKNKGFDWCSLKLVFELFNGDYRLVGIIHSQWTV